MTERERLNHQKMKMFFFIDDITNNKRFEYSFFFSWDSNKIFFSLLTLWISIIFSIYFFYLLKYPKFSKKCKTFDTNVQNYLYLKKHMKKFITPVLSFCNELFFSWFFYNKVNLPQLLQNTFFTDFIY